MKKYFTITTLKRETRSAKIYQDAICLIALSGAVPALIHKISIYPGRTAAVCCSEKEEEGGTTESEKYDNPPESLLLSDGE
jgi:hypothetical protein